MARKLDVDALAAKLGVKRTTVHHYLSVARRNRAAGGRDPADLPEPSGYFGRTPVWDEKVIDQWMARRPGPGPRRRQH